MPHMEKGHRIWRRKAPHVEEENKFQGDERQHLLPPPLACAHAWEHNYSEHKDGTSFRFSENGTTFTPICVRQFCKRSGSCTYPGVYLNSKCNEF